MGMKFFIPNEHCCVLQRVAESEFTQPWRSEHAVSVLSVRPTGLMRRWFQGLSLMIKARLSHRRTLYRRGDKR